MAVDAPVWEFEVQGRSGSGTMALMLISPALQLVNQFQHASLGSADSMLADPKARFRNVRLILELLDRSLMSRAVSERCRTWCVSATQIPCILVNRRCDQNFPHTYEFRAQRSGTAYAVANSS